MLDEGVDELRAMCEESVLMLVRKSHLGALRRQLAAPVRVSGLASHVLLALLHGRLLLVVAHQAAAVASNKLSSC